MATISTHILDTSAGRPAADVALRLDHRRPGGWLEVSRHTTDADGRVRDVGTVAAGTYRIRFEVGPYFEQQGASAWFPWVDIVFTVVEDAGHYHVPLLISPFGYTTYRGS
jgi:5-hydroxyisourate hydrolase